MKGLLPSFGLTVEAVPDMVEEIASLPLIAPCEFAVAQKFSDLIRPLLVPDEYGTDWQSGGEMLEAEENDMREVDPGRGIEWGIITRDSLVMMPRIA